MHSKLIGGILLIVGTTIGAGMLALPLVTLPLGIGYSTLLFIAIWFVMTVAAFYILKVNLTLPHGTNMISMAKVTLGKPGQAVAWVSCLLLLYCLLSAYISGGSDLLASVLMRLHITLPHWLSALIFIFIFGIPIFKGVGVVDATNRALMTVKLGSFFMLVFLLMPKLHLHYMNLGEINALPSALLVVITSFGYAVIIPSLRDYLGEDDHLMVWAVLIGSLIPLVCYVLWIIAVLGVLPASLHLGVLSQLILQLDHTVHSVWVTNFVHLFTYVCLTTSFLGVSLTLTDFIADGLAMHREGWARLKVMSLVYVPPVLIVLFYPAAFVHGLALAGIFCIILLMLLPALMVLKIQIAYRWFVFVEIALALGMLVFAFAQYVTH